MLFASVAVNFLSYNTYYKADAGIQAIQNIPLEMGKWHGKDIPLDNQTYEILETKSIIHRVYKSESGRKVFLSIVYYPETKVDFHAPEACLGGKGIVIKKTKKAVLFSTDNKNIKINLNQLIRRQGNGDGMVYYFYKAGKFIGESYIKLRLNLALNKFFNNTKSGALIRFSTPVISENTRDASSTLKDFLIELYPHLIRFL